VLLIDSRGEVSENDRWSMYAQLKSDLVISPEKVLIGVSASSILIYFYFELVHAQWNTLDLTISSTLLIILLSIAGWVIYSHHPLPGRWFTVLLLSLTVHLWSSLLKLPGAFALEAVIVAFAVPLLGISQAAIVTVGETILFLLLDGGFQTHPDLTGIVPTLISMWAVYIAMLFAYQNYIHKTTWLAEYYDRVQKQIDEARDQRQELVQTLDDLAHANHQLAMLNKRVSDFRIIAEEAQKSKTKFVARVSHEFRTPLNMIIGLVDLIIEKPEIYDTALSPRMRDALNIVHRNSKHLSDMVNDVLDLSRIETERMVLNKERVDLQQIIDSAVDAVRPLLESKKINIVIDVANDLPQVFCDRTRIEQVILNLVSNSARFTERGKIIVCAIQHNQYIRVSVRDTGLGISKEDLSRIFEPFSQGTSEIEYKKGGSGLGLSISKQFIELHNGKMWVESELGIGSTFTFEIPISSPLDPISRPGNRIEESWIWRERQTRAKLPDQRYNPRFVIYDDTGDLSALLARYSGEIDFVTSQSEDQIIAELQQAPADTVLINASNLDQIKSVVEKLKKTIQDTPLIGCSIPRSLDLAKSLGLLGQLIKPVTRADLQQALAQVNQPVRRVLLVDDDVEVLDLFSQMLRVCDSSLQIETTSNGSTALAMLKEQPPDILFLDLVMPELDGWQILEKMYYDKEMPKVPTFFVSAQDPYDAPPHSDFLYIAVENGLSIDQILRFSLGVTNLLFQPEVITDQEPR
jgi:signal transduction histidine kinase/CheY-like chemotaxis protein